MDFRSVYGEVVDKVLRADPKQVLDVVPSELGLLH